MGKTALITGASSGIGEEFAYRLAQQNVNLVLVARSEEKLNLLADQVKQYGIEATVLPYDLSIEYAGTKVFEMTEALGIQVDMLINNAGFALSGILTDIDPEQDHRQVMLNVNAVVDLTHAYLPGMIERGTGAIINLASTVSFQPVPHMAVYGATKAFVLSFSEAIWQEYHDKGIDVLALCPGATDTNFFETAGDVAFGKIRTPHQVVDTALKALKGRKSFVVDGKRNYLTAQLSRILPRKTVVSIAGKLAKPGRKM
ncbi:SDR family NAD(P)-dependent oxidoreductase [Falsibacillus albus]|uniref:SDR family oxidoreductase n=1 Tax=Falsibacillus albus TaxID=2478915 RepID=A0A3L7K132_9BACI|nr:SDR family oxidoreductase [Falsibacillus albus]RLQ96295.1 SDR family oxidoreductase [Falsibacillus albus]